MSSASFDSLLSQLTSSDVAEEITGDERLRVMPPFRAATRLGGVQGDERTHSALTGQPLGARARALQEEVRTYPVVAKADEIMASLHKHRITVLCGDTGSGKTTQMPFIASDFVWQVYDDERAWIGAVWVALPQRGATRKQFERVCLEADTMPGRYAACRTRTTSLGHTQAHLMFMTQGYLAQLVQSDMLTKVGVLILDDAHRRTEQLSFIFAVLKKYLGRPGVRLRIVVMTAENELVLMKRHFEEEVGFVEASGRRFTVYRRELLPNPALTDIDAQIFARVKRLVLERMSASNAILLIFLKGKDEIQELISFLRDKAPRWRTLPYHSDLDAEQQDLVHNLRWNDELVAIVATNAAEMGLSIPVRTVISSCRANRDRTGLDGIPRTIADFCSRVEVRQQGGRAGRRFDGEQILAVPEQLLPQRPAPDILHSNDLRWLVWGTARMGEDLDASHWVPGERPSSYRFQLAEEHLSRARFVERVTVEAGGGDGAAAPVTRGDGAVAPVARLVLTQTGRACGALAPYLQTHHIQFLLICHIRGVGRFAQGVVAFLEAITSKNQAFVDPEKGLNEARTSRYRFCVDPQREALASDLVMVGKIFADFKRARRQREFCERLNLKYRVMRDAKELHDTISYARIAWSEWADREDSLAPILDQAMLEASPLHVAFSSRFYENCHVTASGVRVRVREEWMQRMPAVLPLDTRYPPRDKMARARLAVVLRDMIYRRNCLVLADSFVDVGMERHSMQGAVSRELRRRGFSETLWHAIGGLKLQKAIEITSELAMVDVGVVIYDVNDLLTVHGRVRSVDADFFALVDTLLDNLVRNCRRLTFVVPTEQLFSTWKAVDGYGTACEALRAHIRSRQIHCVDAAGLIGTVRCYDGQHFVLNDETVLVEAVIAWVNEAEATALNPTAPA